jgi:hypothetical protein
VRTKGHPFEVVEQGVGLRGPRGDGRATRRAVFQVEQRGLGEGDKARRGQRGLVRDVWSALEPTRERPSRCSLLPPESRARARAGPLQTARSCQRRPHRQVRDPGRSHRRTARPVRTHPVRGLHSARCGSGCGGPRSVHPRTGAARWP